MFVVGGTELPEELVFDESPSSAAEEPSPTAAAPSNATATPEPSVTTTTSPGFGPLAAVVALLAVLSALAVFRRD
jgi:hypothetical protein